MPSGRVQARWRLEYYSWYLRVRASTESNFLANGASVHHLRGGHACESKYLARPDGQAPAGVTVSAQFATLRLLETLSLGLNHLPRGQEPGLPDTQVAGTRKLRVRQAWRLAFNPFSC